MYPRGVEEGGVDMGNTSAVDLDVGMRVWGNIGNDEDEVKVEVEHENAEGGNGGKDGKDGKGGREEEEAGGDRALCDCDWMMLQSGR